MVELTKAELLASDARQFDTDALSFEGPRGDSARHLDRAALLAAIRALPRGPRDEGCVKLLLARGPGGTRELPADVLLTAEGGMPGDRWFGDERYGPEYQLATMRWDYALVVANDQPPQLHGDNVFLELDLSADNLPVATTLRLGEAVVEVTPQAHNGCKKWAQRFGLAAMQLNMESDFRDQRLRGLYLRVVEDGRVRPGDRVQVLRRGGA